MYYDVIPDKAPLFTAKFQEVLAALKAVPGHKESYLYQRVDDPHSYAILSEWDDEKAFYNFIRSDLFRQVTSWGREQVLRHAPRHKIYPRADDIGPPSQGAHPSAAPE
jgi:heme-degrading monooxygenase HmoA